MTSEESLSYLKAQAERLNLTILCSSVLDDSRFGIWSGASKPFQHHYGSGGLVIHVAEVVRLCLLNNEALGNPINERSLFLAALFHDVGKMYDYERILLSDEEGNPYEAWQGASHKRYIHHITRSALIWIDATTNVRNQRGDLPEDYLWLTEEFVDEVLHAIISHHGQREFGSPVMPKSKLAWMVHLCDGISARMNDADKWDMVHQK